MGYCFSVFPFKCGEFGGLGALLDQRPYGLLFLVEALALESFGSKSGSGGLAEDYFSEAPLDGGGVILFVVQQEELGSYHVPVGLVVS